MNRPSARRPKEPDFEVCTVRVTREIYIRASAMKESIGESYRMSCLLADRDDLTIRGEDVTTEGVLSLATVIGVNHLMRAHGFKLEKWHRNIVVASDSIAVQASMKSERTMVEDRDKKIAALDFELVKKKNQCDEQLKIMRRYEEANARLSEQLEESKKAIRIEPKPVPRKEISVEDVRARVLKEVRDWIVTNESGSQLIARLKTMELPKG